MNNLKVYFTTADYSAYQAEIREQEKEYANFGQQAGHEAQSGGDGVHDNAARDVLIHAQRITGATHTSLRNIVAGAEVRVLSILPADRSERVRLGSQVKLKNLSTGMQKTYRIRSAWYKEDQKLKDKGIIEMSYQSPMSRAMMSSNGGQSVEEGDTFTCNVDGRSTTFEVLSIQAMD